MITDPDAYRDYVEYGQHIASQRPEKRVPLSQALPGYHPEMQNEVLEALAVYDAASHRLRAKPFDPYTTPDEVAEAYDIDPKLAKEVYQKTYDEELTASLMARMGTDVDRPQPTELSMRESIEAAYDLHNGIEE